MDDRPNPYVAHARHIAACTPGGGWTGLVMTLIAIDMAFGFSGGALFAIWPVDALPEGHWIDSTPGGLIVSLALFVVPVVTLAVIVKQFYRDSPLSLLGDVRQVPAQFWAVCKVLIGLNVVLTAVTFIGGGTEGLTVRPVMSWLVFSLISLPFILIQTSSEEVMYRGFLQQRLAGMHASPLIWMVVPSVLFGVTHIGYAGDPVENLFYVVWAFMFGMACADLTARTGSLGAALAFHAVNNAFAFLLVAGEGGPNSGLALFLYPLETIDPNTGVYEVDFLPPDAGAWFFVATLIMQLLPVWMSWMAARIALRR